MAELTAAELEAGGIIRQSEGRGNVASPLTSRSGLETVMPTSDDTRLIPLTQGKVAIVDAADYDWLNQWKWYASKEGRVFYAIRRDNDCGGRDIKVRMHRVILGVPTGLEGDHINGDGLDNRRANLRTVTKQQNSLKSAVPS